MPVQFFQKRKHLGKTLCFLYTKSPWDEKLFSLPGRYFPSNPSEQWMRILEIILFLCLLQKWWVHPLLEIELFRVCQNVTGCFQLQTVWIVAWAGEVLAKLVRLPWNDYRGFLITRLPWMWANRKYISGSWVHARDRYWQWSPNGGCQCLSTLSRGVIWHLGGSLLLLTLPLPFSFLGCVQKLPITCDSVEIQRNTPVSGSSPRLSRGDINEAIPYYLIKHV